MRTFRDAKAMAKSLRAEVLARKQIELPHSECLEIVARQFGVDNWNILSAKTNAAPGPWRAANTTIPVLRIFSVERAKQFYVDFLGCTLDFGGPSGGEGTPSTARCPGPGPPCSSPRPSTTPTPGRRS